MKAAGTKAGDMTADDMTTANGVAGGALAFEDGRMGADQILGVRNAR